MELIFAFLKAFLLTVAIEGLVIYLIFKNGRYVYYSLLCNLLTNPALNLALLLLLHFLGYTYYYPLLLLLELAAVLVEALVYRTLTPLGFIKSFLLSPLLNVISFAIGFVLSFFLGG